MLTRFLKALWMRLLTRYHRLRNNLRSIRLRYKDSGSPYYFFIKLEGYLRRPLTTLRRFRLAGLLDPLPEKEQVVVDQLKAAGFSSQKVEKLQGLNTVIELGRRRLDEFLACEKEDLYRTEKKKFFTKDLLRTEDFTSNSDFLKFALQPSILRMATAYLGQAPFLTSMILRYSYPTPADTWVESQKWHRDYNDTKEFKVFVYISDVLEVENGPFTFLPLAASQRVPNTLIPTRVEDETVRRLFPNEIHSVMGPSGTVTYIDTAKCYHFGSRCLKPRLAFWLCFNTFAGLYPHKEVGFDSIGSSELPTGLVDHVVRKHP